MGSTDRRPHALVIPLAHRGHWHPLKMFIRQLVNLNISFTVLASPDEISELQQLQDVGEFDRLQSVELVEAFSNPPKKRMLKTLETLLLMKEKLSAQPALLENFIAQRSAGCGPTFLVADMFLFWTQEIADQLGIPRYTFFTSPTTFALLVLHAPELIAYDPSVTKKPDEVVNLPGMEAFRASDICTAIFEIPEVYKLHSAFLPKAAGILINSWESYEVAEAAALHTCLQTVVGDARVPSIHLIGPMRPPVQRVDQNVRKVTAETDDSGCLRFLNTQPALSVLYICFGSVVELGQSSVMELAQALELCEVPFLWVLPRPNRTRNLPSYDVSDILPQGFQSRTEGRGFVCTGWAPQPDILAHSSVGGFISHCGWNSLVETILAGVAIITWPYWAEQLMNARILVEVKKVGVRIQPTADGTFVAREIAKAVAILMNSDEGKETRLRMQAMKRAVDNAVGDGGSSFKVLRAFEAEVSSLH